MAVAEIYLDAETQRVADEVQGGWDNIRAFGLSVAVTWDAVNGYRDWYEVDGGRLIGELRAFDRIVTFNGLRFDLEVLSAYGDVSELRGKSLDLLQDLKRRLGVAVSAVHHADRRGPRPRSHHGRTVQKAVRGGPEAR